MSWTASQANDIHRQDVAPVSREAGVVRVRRRLVSGLLASVLGVSVALVGMPDSVAYADTTRFCAGGTGQIDGVSSDNSYVPVGTTFVSVWVPVSSIIFAANSVQYNSSNSSGANSSDTYQAYWTPSGSYYYYYFRYRKYSSPATAGFLVHWCDAP